MLPAGSLEAEELRFQVFILFMSNDARSNKYQMYAPSSETVNSKSAIVNNMDKAHS